MSPRRLSLLLSLSSLLVSAQASAQGLVWRLPGLGPTGFTITNTSLVNYRGSNFNANTSDDNFFSFTERLDLAAQAAPWRLYLRLDGFSPFLHDTSCTGTRASDCYLASNYRPERLSLRYQRGDITVEGGDFYQVFGRGVALAFRKVDPIGLDTTLRGARFEIDRERLTVRGFVGVSNPQNLDPISLAVFPDPDDILVGASAGARVGPDADIEVSGHVVHAQFERNPSNNRQDDVDIAGWRFEVPSLFDGDLTFYGEANIMRRTTHEGSAAANIRYGRGIFAAAQLVRNRWTLLFEFKDYTHYLLAPTESANATPRDVARLYSSAPSLERDDQRPFTNANARGGRIRVDYAVQPSPWILTFNSLLYGWAESTDGTGAPIDPWDGQHGIITSHTYFTVRRRSRPAPGPTAPAPADPSGAQRPGAATPAAAGGANINAGGVGGASVTRVASGDFALTASIGYRREFFAGNDPTALPGDRFAQQAGDIKHESIQADIDYAFPVGRNDSLELRVDNRFERNYTFERLPGDFSFNNLTQGVRGGVAVSWSHGLPLVVSAMLRWDNTSRSAGTADLGQDPFGTLHPVSYPTLYPAGEIRWNFSLGNFLRVFAGMTPGGRVCSGGVCRDVPLFQGGIAELVIRI